MAGGKDRTGEEIGDYRLKRLLGSGKAGAVYLAEHRFLGMPGALKLFHKPAPSNSDKVFSEGVRAASLLIHANIVRVLNGGIAGGYPYLVTDYAPGGNLRDRCPRGSTLPLQVIAHYLRQCASALDFSHNRDGSAPHIPLVHCDVKPENILFGAKQEVLLTDFDLALTVPGLREITQDTDGDVTYMAPEHLQSLVGPACDQYALATVVYELLCGHPPFQGDALEVMRKKISMPAPPLPDTVPPAVAKVVMKALARAPKARYPTALAFAAAFEAALRHSSS
jgi:serine/threonine protein kinase